MISTLMEEYKLVDGNATGLKLRKDRFHGWTWNMPDTPLGRETADKIDASLAKLGDTLAQPQRSR